MPATREAPQTAADELLAEMEHPVLDGTAAPAPRAYRRFYIPLRLKFLLIALVSFGWLGFSIWVAIPWIDELSSGITLVGAILLVGGIAIVPGYLNAHLIASVLFDRPPPLRFDLQFPAVTVMIACFNEQERIEETLDYLCAQRYPGELRIIVADDGSEDRTAELASARASLDPRISVLRLPHRGKAPSLNAAVAEATTPLIATVDADTLLMRSSLRRAVSRLLVSPPHTVAVAGAVFVRNSRENFVAKAQEWDYFLGIASIKRQQGLLQGTMVAQGSFSVYRTRAVREAGGWPDRIGEDIVLTWALMENGGGVSYEATAAAFTLAPVTLPGLMRQRRRWARGMIEGLREHGRGLLGGHRPYVHAVLTDLAFPYIDFVYATAFPVGLVLAAFGNFAIIGPLTLLVIPLNVLLALLMFRLNRRSFAEVGLRVRRNRVGFLGYLLAYQLFMSPVSVIGYAQELFRTPRDW